MPSAGFPFKIHIVVHHLQPPEQSQSECRFSILPSMVIHSVPEDAVVKAVSLSENIFLQPKARTFRLWGEGFTGSSSCDKT